jgi:hypothetical protein
VGAVLLALALAAAPVVLTPDAPPGGALSAIGFGLTTPRPLTGEHSFALRLGIRLHGCDNPADITLVASASSEWWSRHNAALASGRSTLHLIVPGAGFRLLGAHTTGFPEELAPLNLSPDDAGVAAVTSRPTRWGTREITVTLDRWGDTNAAVAVRFQGAWLSPRGLGTCYLRLPALVGLAGLPSTDQITGQVSRQPRHVFNGAPVSLRDPASGLSFPIRDGTRNAEILNGATAVDAHDVDVDTSESTPPPNSFSRQQAIWACTAKPVGLRDLFYTTSESQIALPESQLGAQAAQNCAALAVVRAAGAAWQRDVALVLVGALLSLGVSLIVEVVLALRKSD